MRLFWGRSLIWICAWLFVGLSALVTCRCEDGDRPYPLWDGQEKIESYARRVGLSPTRTIDLGKGVALEMVLIPAGRFTMGAQMAGDPAVPEEPMALCLAAFVLMVGLLAAKFAVAKRRRKPFQFSLRFGLLLVILGSGVCYGTVHWYSSTQEVARWKALKRLEEDFYQGGNRGDALPQRLVTLSRPFFMSRFEVTQAQYERVTGVNPSFCVGPQLPVERVNWDQAEAFCRRLSLEHGGVFRLPTEAEWEFACRAGTKTEFYTGDTEADMDKAGWYQGNTPWKPGDEPSLLPVGQKAPNAFGLYDMHGNLAEMCADGYVLYSSTDASVTDPRGTVDDYSYAVCRGGSVDDLHFHCTSWARCGAQYRFESRGTTIRLVMEIGGKAEADAKKDSK